MTDTTLFDAIAKLEKRVAALEQWMAPSGEPPTVGDRFDAQSKEIDRLNKELSEEKSERDADAGQWQLTYQGMRKELAAEREAHALEKTAHERTWNGTGVRIKERDAARFQVAKLAGLLKNVRDTLERKCVTDVNGG